MMRHLCVIPALAGAVIGLSATVANASPFTPGNIVLYRAGDGASGLLNTGAAVFVDEFTPAGVLVQSLPLNSSASGINLIASGTATSEGLLTVSPNGRYITVTGYNRAVGGSGSLAGTAAATVGRSVAVIDSTTGATTYSSFSDFADGNNPRSAVTDDTGTGLWMAGGAGGVRYAAVGSSTSTQLSTTVTNLRQVNIFAGQLMVSTSSGSAVRIGAVGSGVPITSGQTITNLPGIPTSGSPYGFFFADLSAAVAGNDTLYVASDDAAGITKYTLTGGSWVADGVVGVSADAYRGITGSVSGGVVTLFATRKGGSGATGGGELVSLTDSSGYDGTLAASPTVLATATSNTAFRGVGLVIPSPGSIALLGLGGLVISRRRR